MEARFVVKTQMTREIMRDYQRASKKDWERAISFIAAAIIVLCAVYLWIADSSRKVPYGILAVAVLLFELFETRLKAWIVYRGYNKSAGELEFNFFDEYIAGNSALEEARIQYGAFVRVAENSKYCFLYVQKRMAYVLPKRAFTQGDPEKFSAFIAEKTGLEIKRVRG